jgi:hypothetical protein
MSQPMILRIISSEEIENLKAEPQKVEHFILGPVEPDPNGTGHRSQAIF